MAVMSGISVWDVLAVVCWISADGRIVLLCHLSPGPLGRRELQSGLSAEVAFGCFLPWELWGREGSNWYLYTRADCKYLFRVNLNLGMDKLH